MIKKFSFKQYIDLDSIFDLFRLINRFFAELFTFICNIIEDAA